MIITVLTSVKKNLDQLSPHPKDYEVLPYELTRTTTLQGKNPMALYWSYYSVEAVILCRLIFVGWRENVWVCAVGDHNTDCQTSSWCILMKFLIFSCQILIFWKKDLDIPDVILTSRRWLRIGRWKANWARVTIKWIHSWS